MNSLCSRTSTKSTIVTFYHISSKIDPLYITLCGVPWSTLNHLDHFHTLYSLKNLKQRSSRRSVRKRKSIRCLCVKSVVAQWSVDPRIGGVIVRGWEQQGAARTQHASKRFFAHILRKCQCPMHTFIQVRGMPVTVFFDSGTPRPDISTVSLWKVTDFVMKKLEGEKDMVMLETL